jgi:hypothetical protein
LEGGLRVACGVVCPTILFWRSGVVKRARLHFQIVFSALRYGNSSSASTV